jgi:hypothetical protein
VVGELARDASQQEPLESVQASGAHDDEVGILLLCDLDDDVRRVPLARMCARLDRRISERATGARQNGFGPWRSSTGSRRAVPTSRSRSDAKSRYAVTRWTDA